MANHYMSVNTGGDGLRMVDVAHSGSSSTAGDKIELRADTSVTKHDILQALEVFKRWIIQGGLNGLGANLPPR